MSSDRDKHLLRVLRKGAKTDADVFRPGYDLLNYAGSAAQRLLEVMSRGQRGWPGWLRDMARRLNVTEADLAEAAPKFALFMRLIRTGSLNYTIAEAASRSGFDQSPAPVKSIYYAFVGQLMLSGVWDAARADSGAPPVGPDPKLDPNAAVRSAERAAKELT